MKARIQGSRGSRALKGDEESIGSPGVGRSRLRWRVVAQQGKQGAGAGSFRQDQRLTSPSKALLLQSMATSGVTGSSGFFPEKRRLATGTDSRYLS